MRTTLTLLLALLATAGPVTAADVSPAEAKLREGLRATMLQLRSAQAEKAAVDAAKAELEVKNQELTTELEALKKKYSTDKEAGDKRIADLEERVTVRAKEVEGLQMDVDKWKSLHKDAAALAAKKEGERAKLNSEKIVLERKVADQQTKNAQLFQIGNEVLSRYAKFGLGTALTAREPFVGLTRVKLQNLVQDYADKLADQKIKP